MQRSDVRVATTHFVCLLITSCYGYLLHGGTYIEGFQLNNSECTELSHNSSYSSQKKPAASNIGSTFITL